MIREGTIPMTLRPLSVSEKGRLSGQFRSSTMTAAIALAAISSAPAFAQSSPATAPASPPSQQPAPAPAG